MDLIQRTNLKPETRLSDNRRLTFYAAIYDVPVTIVERGKTYREIIRRGAFDESLRAGDRVVANIDHRTDEFARTPQLLLQSDKKGLFATVWLDESDDVAERVKNRIERGELRGTSFKAVPLESIEKDGIIERTKLRLIDVCLASVEPAYPTEGEVMLRTKDAIAAKFQFLMQKLRLLKMNREG